jgi:hypothetical protein
MTGIRWGEWQGVGFGIAETAVIARHRRDRKGKAQTTTEDTKEHDGESEQPGVESKSSPLINTDDTDLKCQVL